MSEVINLRFSSASWYDKIKGKRILIVGAGGIGSHVALTLSKFPVTIMIMDGDKVEPHNIGTQFYSIKDIGLYKTEALNIALRLYGVAYIVPRREFLTSNTYSILTNFDPNVIILALDNMDARSDIAREINSEISDGYINTDLVIDGRMEAEMYHVLAYEPEDDNQYEWYKSTLIPDGIIEEGICSLRQTNHVSMRIGAEIATIITNFYDGVMYDRELQYSSVTNSYLIKNRTKPEHYVNTEL